MNNQTIIYLVRHGQSESNILSTFTGQLDARLSETGVLQAQRVKDYFNGVKIDAIYSSDLIRAVNTIKPLANERNLPVITDKNFREIDGGKWQGVVFDEIAEKYKADMQVWISDLKNARCTGGESVVELGERVCKALKNVCEQNANKTIIIATHATPVRAILSFVEVGSVENIGKVKWSPNASITKLYFNGKNFKIEILGDSAHLEGLITELPKSV